MSTSRMLLAGVIIQIAVSMVAVSGAARAENGEELYVGYCSSCHAPQGRGAKGPRLVPFRFTDEEALRLIREPECDMPAFPKSQLSDEQVVAILGYLRSIS